MSATVDRPSKGSARKAYAIGSDPTIRVPMREISLTNGETHVVYDTSGPYTDPDVATDVRQGLAPLRASWIAGRGDTVELDRATSLYRLGREAMPELDAIRFDAGRKPRRAKPGANVTQMHYARRGEITQEMEFVAIREGVAPEFVRATRSRAAAPCCRRT